MEAHIVKIGNSQGIRIPKTILAQTGLSGRVQLEVDGDRLVIKPIDDPRPGWDKAFALMAERGDDALLESASSTTWDDQEWEW
jgi:antitoxin MazE